MASSTGGEAGIAKSKVMLTRRGRLFAKQAADLGSGTLNRLGRRLGRPLGLLPKALSALLRLLLQLGGALLCLRTQAGR